MTDKTATQNLTRTTSTDDPRQMASYLKTLAEEVDRRMQSQFYHLGRSQAPPFALLRLTTPVAFDQSAFPPAVPFDTVAVDTAGMADLSIDQQIRFTSTGYYCVGGYVLSSGFGGVTADTYMFAGEAQGSGRDQGSGAIGVSASAIQLVTTLGSTARMVVGNLGSSTGNITTLFFAELWAYKVRDV